MLWIEHLTIEFYDHMTPETVVYDFQLQMRKGESIGIVGESGSGKTMISLAIAGLLRRKDMKKSGSIRFDQIEMLQADRKELRELQGNRIGIVFQEPMTSLNPVRTIGWQVEESLRIHTQMNKSERYQRVIEVLREVELQEPEKLYHSYPHQLSGGMRQRVMIAAAIICNPDLLIADEPTTALDVTIQAQIIKLLKKINKERNMSILFISHDLSLVKKLCERVLVMQAGSLVESGTCKEIFEHPKEAYTKELIQTIPVCKKE